MRSPIGVFDSGLGGLSVAARIMELLPAERIIYLADNAHVPYGERPLDEIQEFALGIVGFLIARGAKAVVMACNMSSAVALGAAQEQHPDVPVLGVIDPGAQAAVNVCEGEPIGILATTGTVKTEAYVRAIARFCPSVQVSQQACPAFVPLVESGDAEGEEAEAAACTYVNPLIAEQCRTIILGCTHYPFLRKAIECAAGKGVRIVDPAEETARALQNTLVARGLASDELSGSHEFYATSDTDVLANLGGAFLGTPIEEVRRAVWGVDLALNLKLITQQ